MRSLSLVLLLALIASHRLAAQGRAVLDEPFESNVRAWWIGAEDRASASMSGGVYRVSWAKPGEWWYLTRSASIDARRDYTIEVRLRQVSGVTNQAFGVVWGVGNGRFNAFFISGDGHVKISRLDGSWVDPVGWTKTAAVRGMGEQNTLRIERRGGTIRYLVNGAEAATSAALDLFGSDIGFFVQETMTIEFDHLSVHQDQPAIRVAPGAPTSVEKVNLGPNVNTEYHEFVPVISGDGRTLYYSIRHSPLNPAGPNDPDEIWYSIATSDSTWGMRRREGAPINNASSNWVISVSPDNQTLLLGNTYNSDGSPKGGGVSMSRRTASGWSVPEDVRITNLVNNSTVNTFCLSPDRKVMLMSVVGPVTEGGHDLYISFLQKDGSWSEPRNLGPTLNSFGAEWGPFLAADGITLYYASDGLPGYGSSDIFMARRLDDTWLRWSEPMNMGPAINSAASDGYFTVPASGRWAYMVSDDRSIGMADIFRLRIPAAVAPRPAVLVTGRVIDSRTEKPLTAEITYRDLAGDQEIGLASSNPADGVYQIVLPAGRAYSFMADRAGYYAVSDNLDLSELEEYREIRRDLYLTPVEVGSTIRLNNLFFDVGRWDLRPESTPELERAVRFLEANPSMRIEVSGHTDNVGSDDDNRVLSENRARAVMAWLASHGIAATRLSARGYGESKPVAGNESDEGRQRNRRVEFTIVGR